MDPTPGSLRYMPEFVTLQTSDEFPGVGTILLNRPPMNALSRQVQSELADAAREATRRDDIKSVVVYGGPKVLAAGADIKEMNDMTYAEMRKVAGQLQDGLSSIAAIPKPTVAAITGYALGGGLEVALGADRRIAGDNAKLGVPEILLGVIPGGGGTQRLSRLIGPAKAKDMVFTGRFVGAAEALRSGSSTRSSLRTRSTTRRFGGRRSSPARPAWRLPQPRRPSTKVSTSTCAPASRSRSICSPRCSPPTTVRSVWRRLSRTARAKQSSQVNEYRSESSCGTNDFAYQ